MGLSRARAHAPTTMECSRVSSWGSIKGARCVFAFLGLGALGRCERPRKRSAASLAARMPETACHAGTACPGLGRSTRARVEGLEGCVHVSYRVAEIVRRRCCPKKLSSCLHGGGERGLAQSGRPRRANRRRASDRGGKIARSVQAGESVRKDVVVSGTRSMKGASGRRSRSLFTRVRSKRSRLTSCGRAFLVYYRGVAQKWVTGASEVSCSMATIAGENTPCRSASRSLKRVARRESVLHTVSTGESSMDRSPNDAWVLVDIV